MCEELSLKPIFRVVWFMPRFAHETVHNLLNRDAN